MQESSCNTIKTRNTTRLCAVFIDKDPVHSIKGLAVYAEAVVTITAIRITHVLRGFNLKTILTVNNLMKSSTINSNKAIIIKVQEFKNKVMSRVTILLITCFFYLQLTAQLKTVITYKETGKIDFQDFKPNSEESNTDSSLEQFNLKKMLLVLC